MFVIRGNRVHNTYIKDTKNKVVHDSFLFQRDNTIIKTDICIIFERLIVPTFRSNFS